MSILAASPFSIVDINNAIVAGGNAVVPAIITRNAVNLFIPGHSIGSGISTSTGATVTYSTTFVNNSGAAITKGSLCLSGWILTTAGTSPCGNNIPITGTIEYPIGVTLNTMLQSGSSALVAPNGSDQLTDAVTLTTPIPARASFKVNLSSTQAAGQFYVTNLGLTGVMTTALNTTLKKEMLFGIGDSIATNNALGVWTNAATAVGCPSVHGSISGTTAQAYGATPSTGFNRQVNLAMKLGATRFASNFGTNDLGSSSTYTQILGWLGGMKTLAASSGIKFTQTTITPRSTSTSVVPSAVTSVGTNMTVATTQTALFTVGNVYQVTGATQTEYNGQLVCTAINAGVSVTLLFPGSVTPTATGSIAVNGFAGWSNANFFTPIGSQYVGAGSDRGMLNSAIRAGAFDGYIEFGDACELVRNSSIWKVGGDDAVLGNSLTCQVISGSPMTATRFQTNFTGGNSTTAGGWAQFTSGANIGYNYFANGNTGGDYTSGTAFPNIPTVGDGLVITQGATRATDDGLHPRVSIGGQGGQLLIDNPTIAWLTGLLT